MEERRVVFVGDEEGEIEFYNYLKNGWHPTFNTRGKINIVDGMVAMQKKYERQSTIDPVQDIPDVVAYMMSLAAATSGSTKVAVN